MIDLRPAPGPRLALQLTPRDEGLSVRVVESPVGEAAADVVLQHIDEVLRLVSKPTFHEDVGRGLFRSLLPGPLGELYRAAFAQATLAGERLTIELRFDRELVRIARYPWELLHDGTRFLLQAGAVNLVRYLTFPEPPRPLAPRSPLEILVVSARPKDQPPLASEFDELQKVFQPLIADDKLDLAFLLPPTWDSLMDWLLAGAPGILHFEGHGAFTRTGLLIFENPDGESDPVDAATLGSAFYSTDLRLAVLSACETAKAAGESLLGSVAPALIVTGIPAVVAMQQSLPDDAAVRFSRGFYHALLAGQDLESAVMAGRKQLVRTMYWHVPTLYLRASKTPEIKQAFLERRIDTAGPRSAPVGLPLRFGLWIRRPDSPQPSDDELRRLLGLEREEAVSREMTRAAMHFPVEVGQIKPGAVEVRISVPGCDLHTSAIKQMTVFADFDTPPLWFPMTPRQVGRLDVTFELYQGGAVIASVAHTIRVTAGAEGESMASVKSHGGEPPAPLPSPLPPSPLEPVKDIGAPPESVPAGVLKPGEKRKTGESEPLMREQARDGERESDERQREKTEPPPLPAAQTHREVLDGVGDWFQTGEPPEDKDDPLYDAESEGPPGTEEAEIAFGGMPEPAEQVHDVIPQPAQEARPPAPPRPEPIPQPAPVMPPQPAPSDASGPQMQTEQAARYEPQPYAPASRAKSSGGGRLMLILVVLVVLIALAVVLAVWQLGAI